MWNRSKERNAACVGQNYMQKTNKLASPSVERTHAITSGRLPNTHTRHTFSDVNQIYLSVNLCSMLNVAMQCNKRNCVLRWPTNPLTKCIYKRTSKLYFETNELICFSDIMCPSEWSNGTCTHCIAWYDVEKLDRALVRASVFAKYLGNRDYNNQRIRAKMCCHGVVFVNSMKCVIVVDKSTFASVNQSLERSTKR